MISLTEAMLIGVPQVDNQHRKLIDAINRFTEACTKGEGRKQIEETLRFVVAYTQDHFKDEERIQEQYGYPGVTKHKWIHAQFIQHITGLVHKFQQTGPTVTLVGELSKTLGDWVVNHIRIEDKKIGEHILKAGAV